MRKSIEEIETTLRDTTTEVNNMLLETTDEITKKHLKKLKNNLEYSIEFARIIQRRAKDLKKIEEKPLTKATRIDIQLNRRAVADLSTVPILRSSLEKLIELKNLKENDGKVHPPEKQPLIEKMASEDVESEETVVIMSETVKEEAAQDVEMVSVSPQPRKTPPPCSTLSKPQLKKSAPMFSPISLETVEADTLSDSELGMTPKSSKSIVRPSGHVEDDQNELEKSTVVQLRQKLSDKGLPLKGNKKTLIERLKNNTMKTSKSGQNLSGYQTPPRKGLTKSTSSPALGSNKKRPHMPQTPTGHTPQTKQSKRIGRAATRAAPPRAGSSRPGSRLRSPSPLSSNSRSLFSLKTPTQKAKSSTSLFDTKDSSSLLKETKGNKRDEFDKKKKEEAERLKRKKEEQEALREQKRREKEDKHKLVKQKRMEQEKKRNEELLKKQQATGKPKTMKERREQMAKQKQLRKIHKSKNNSLMSTGSLDNSDCLFMGKSFNDSLALSKQKIREKPKAISEEKSSEEPVSSSEVALDATKVIGSINQNSTFVVKASLPTPATPVRNAPPPAQDSYQMTPQFSDKARSMNNEDDYGLDDLSSGDETDDEDNPRKNIPNWAKKYDLTYALRRQYKIRIDAELVFGSCYADKNRQVDFEQIFALQLKGRRDRMAKINQRRETSLWDAPMKENAPLADRTLNLDESCFPPEEPRVPKRH